MNGSPSRVAGLRRLAAPVIDVRRAAARGDDADAPVAARVADEIEACIAAAGDDAAALRRWLDFEFSYKGVFDWHYSDALKSRLSEPVRLYWCGLSEIGDE